MSKILIIHHNDHDGYVAAGIMGFYLYKNNKGSLSIKYLEADYIQPLDKLIEDNTYDVYSYDKIFLLDYSISTDENAKFILDLQEKSEVIWIDHHKSSIDTIQKYTRLLSIPGYRVIGMSGALLAWVYNNMGFLPLKYCTKLEENSNTYNIISVGDIDEIIKYTHTPITITAVHYYDIWDHRNPETELFHLGYNIENPNDIFAVITAAYADLSIYKDAVNSGKVIKEYVDAQNKEYCESSGFEISIYDKYTDRTYSVFALNTDRCTSLTFGDNMDKYDICMPFYYNGKKHAWSHSLYTNKADVDCSYIAKALGGGGHQKAAGFTMKTCVTDMKDRIISI